MSKVPARAIVINYMNQVTEPVQMEPENSDSSAWREILSTLGILLTALLVALFIIGFIFRSYQVDGPSMESTLHNADKLIIWKVPRSWARLTRHPYIPGRGDVVVFNESGLSEFGQDNTKQLIKRVIALPGERIVVSGGKAKVYNQAHPNGFSPDETLPYGRVIPTTSGNVDIKLKKDELFVMGDNRPDSLDSRAFGPIKANQLVGKLALKLFPIGQAKTF
jgi:signal peptidase I